MKVKWIGTVAVLAIVAGVVILKIRSHEKTAISATYSDSSQSTPQVVLVAKPGEAASVARCGQIVREVRAAAQRGVSVREISPDSKSELMSRYRVLTTPTVLILETNGAVRARYEGEAPETLEAIRTEMKRLQP
jgi:hypothetical protein